MFIGLKVILAYPKFGIFDTTASYDFMISKNVDTMDSYTASHLWVVDGGGW
jgi:hypothetical protein